MINENGYLLTNIQAAISFLLNLDDNANSIQTFNDNDIIFSWGGDDILSVSNGNNIVMAGSGNDTVYSGDNDDIIKLREGNDTAYSGAGNDIQAEIRK